MSDKQIKKILIVGGGSAGWMTAAALSNALRGGCEIQLVESASIGTIGVGEATIPPIKLFNQSLGLEENEFVSKTMGSFKLGIQFVDWGKKGTRYFHPFGTYGVDFDAIPIHQHWLKAKKEKQVENLDDYCMAWAAAVRGKFHPPSRDHSKIQSTFDYAYHFDTGMYSRYLRQYAEARGVVRIEGKVVNTTLDTESGYIQSIKLEQGKSLEADFFIDCSGFRGLLIEGALQTGYENWTHWLPCDRAVTVGSEQAEDIIPYTRATAKTAGWQWRIPLQHRTGNGHVYCSEHMSDDEATSVLLNDIDTKKTCDPFVLRFSTGRRKKFWNKNCVAIGLSAGFLEPLESTGLHLIQTAIRRLIALFPESKNNGLAEQEFNRITIKEYETTRDFLILHYKATQRDDSEFWNYVRNMQIPESLQYKMDHFQTSGRLVSDGVELFANPSWLAVYLGQHHWPQHYDPKLDLNPNKDALYNLQHLRELMAKVAASMPSHAEYINRFCKAVM
ncbi:MAG: tryptophan 7-halogenase [Gammaproteobacteria bacterium]|nr:tryptophan 7-halogenase [Gammaproteobacteria bacterium]